MNRKTLIVCLSVLGVMLLGVVILLAVLFSGTGKSAAGTSRATKLSSSQEILTAVPSSAVAVVLWSKLQDVEPAVLLHDSFADALSGASRNGVLPGLKKSPLAVSYYYSGSPVPLYILDLGKSDALPEAEAAAVEHIADSLKLYHGRIDCSKIMTVAKSLSHNTLLAVSRQTNLIDSAERHLQNSISVLDSDGFARTLDKLSGDNLILVSNISSDKLVPALLAGGLRSSSRFLNAFSAWTGFSFVSTDRGIRFNGAAEYDSSTDFASVIAASEFHTSTLSEVLPSYTFFALTIPFRNAVEYRLAYEAWLDTSNRLQKVNARRSALASRDGVSPVEWEAELDIQEVACASWAAGQSLVKVNLAKLGKGVKDAQSHPGFLSSLYGSLFDLPDETHSTVADGWLISGSADAINDYVSGKALDYTLRQSLSDASVADYFAEKPACTAYVNLKENLQGQKDIFSASALPGIAWLGAGAVTCPVFLSMRSQKGEFAAEALYAPSVPSKSKAPSFDRDVDVPVPAGPFPVKNCGTGKMNTFYQTANGAVCLKDENGKGLWGVPVDGKLCGTASTVDYYKNGKLQIIFAAGSKVYLIDRLGHFVSSFPLELGKEILLGPAVYDLSGAKRYNILVLNTDNTIEMYNLKGQKPTSWRTIAPESTVISLPERLEVGGSTFWAVRTSVETLIYPLMGGDPVFRNEGDARIRPDSAVEVLPEGKLKLVSYDGKVRTVKVK